ncbi:CopD family protein [Burkholderia pseudomallei]|uniref:CopD family protein n=1 Tax=Burkholderia pseudomallei TaxID=28450 RepID=UPI00050F51B7|nr:CopD family protein [Burkholderia pseudomallei]KGD58882.1 copper resistance D family protein [Burkholderia pseudomallei]MBF3561468.1 CopD family protein [Burkholderia pseudomallei]OMR21170.1 copper resistance protein CopD [Burkholderia pseudomallei]CAJ4520831.1 putative copper resistance protein D [Burkholderia pseudomallei]CAJ5665654.1 putative copper resistance protein D [Burkholderia pseudomallei]
MNDGFLGMVRLAGVALQSVCFAIAVGVLLGDQWLARAASPWQAQVGRRLARTLRLAALGMLLSSMLAFWVHCALMSETALWDAWPAVRSMLAGTGYGRAWLAGAALMLAVVGLSFARSGGDARVPFALWLALAGVALARSNGGHPVDAGLFSAPVWIDWLHLLAISAWVGLVIVATYVVVPRLADARGGERRNGAAFVQSLSDAATFALVVLLSTGAYNGWRGVGAPANLIGSAYGQVLLLKLALVAFAAALGGHNRFFEMPALLAAFKAPPDARAFVRSLRRFGVVLQVESVVLLGVIAAAAVLASSPLPGTL